MPNASVPLLGNVILPVDNHAVRQIKGHASAAVLRQGENISHGDHVGKYLLAKKLNQYEVNLQEARRKFESPRTERDADPHVPLSGNPLPRASEPEAKAQHETPLVVAVNEGDWRIKPFPSLVEALRALATAEKPFEKLAAVSKDLYAVLSGHSLDVRTRELLKTTTIIFDAGASLDPRVTLIHMFGEAGRISADALEGKSILERDVATLMSSSDEVMALKRESKPAVVKAMRVAMRGAGKHGPQVLSDFKHAMEGNAAMSHPAADWLLEGAAPSPDTDSISHKHPLAGQQLERTLQKWYATNNISYRYFSVLRDTGHGEDRRAALTQADSSSTVAPELIPRIAPELPPESPPELVLSLALNGSHDVPQPRLVVSHEEEAGVLPWEDRDEIDSFHLTYTEGVPSDKVDAQPENGSLIVERVGEVPSVTYAWIGDVPVMRRHAADIAAQWQPIGLGPYRVDVAAPDGAILFMSGGRDYLQLDGHVYAVRTIQVDSHWLVSRSDASLPHLPLSEENGTFRVKQALLDNEVEDVGAVEGDDGMVRWAGAKSIHFGGKLIVVRRTAIDGESALFNFIETPSGALSAPNDLGISHLDNGVEMIEGEYGYYRLLGNDAANVFYISNVSGDVKVVVECNLETKKWSVVDAGSLIAAERRSDPQAALIDGEVVEARQGKALMGDEIGGGAADFGPEVNLDDVRSEEHMHPANVLVQGVSGQSTEASQASSSPAAVRGVEPGVALLPEETLHRAPFDSENFLEVSRRIRRKEIGFLRQRPKLARLIDTALLDIRNLAPISHYLEHTHDWLVCIRTLRIAIARTVAKTSGWRQKSIVEKQAIIAEAARITYYQWLSDGFVTVAHCNEMADLLFDRLRSSRRTRSNILQISLKERTGMTHVIVLYAENPGRLSHFGAVNDQTPLTQAEVPKFDQAQFSQWMFKHRGSVLLLDAWGEDKLLDFSEMTSEAQVAASLNAFVTGADFKDVPARYTVQVVVPGDPTLVVPRIPVRRRKGELRPARSIA